MTTLAQAGIVRSDLQVLLATNVAAAATIVAQGLEAARAPIEDESVPFTGVRAEETVFRLARELDKAIGKLAEAHGTALWDRAVGMVEDAAAKKGVEPSLQDMLNILGRMIAERQQLILIVQRSGKASPAMLHYMAKVTASVAVAFTTSAKYQKLADEIVAEGGEVTPETLGRRSAEGMFHALDGLLGAPTNNLPSPVNGAPSLDDLLRKLAAGTAGGTKPPGEPFFTKQSFPAERA